MNIVKVNASTSYEVKIGAGLLSSLGAEVAAVAKAQIAAIVSDSNVWPLYGETVAKSLGNSGFSVVSYVFPAGESSKNGSTYLSVMNFLAQNHITRSDCLIALGGGVVGDLTGFAAATYLRGIAFIQVPTTLLAAVDSSVGGKTAIDLECGKNLVGAFYQPKLVLCDTDTLNTLPDDTFRDGCAEVIKYGILYDARLFAHLQEKGLAFDREAVITRCVELKRDVVAEDEFDTGSRMKLNLGHTIGHGVEAGSHYTVSHGKAVAIGMAIVSRAAEKEGICDECTKNSIVEILKQFGLPTDTEFSAKLLYSAALSDKKRTGGTVNLIVPETIGRCVIRPTPVETLKTFIQEGL
ncbi:MAG: 3-dehydroquinate synthase [Ruminococcaceae bacterium]|nr:3-dehydroquinate synthase [Oscillospiraceae bacterium]